jgi:2-dehydro-3-deoxyphosphogalactonate aldolase
MKLSDALAECPIVAIVRGIRPSEVLDHAEILFAAGVRGIEVPLNSPQPLDSIRLLAEHWGERMVVGAGTVLDADNVDAVAQAGGVLIISPNTNQAVIRRAVELGLDPAPGFATASEAFQALDAGAQNLKLFPAVTYGPGHLKQLKAVLPASAIVWAVGGAGPENMADWWAAGARAFGLGGEIYKAGQSLADTAAKAARAVGVARTLTAHPSV